MKRLLLDAGNTRIKLAIADAQGWRLLGSLPTGQASGLGDYLAGEHAAELEGVQQLWASNVAGADVARQIEELCASRLWSLHFIKAQAIQCGVRNGYVVPAQLGSDRWATLIAAWHQLGAACLVVNCGTATTIDALSDNGEFQGGLILPGIELMQRSLIGATADLQTATGEYAAFPRCTADALLSGAIQAACGAIQRQYALLGIANAPVLLSGGAAHVLVSHLSNISDSVSSVSLSGPSPDNSLVPSFPRRRESSYKNSPRSGQDLGIDPLRGDFSINWIPAYAGMTSLENSGLFSLNLPVQIVDNLVLQGLSLIAQGAGEA